MPLRSWERIGIVEFLQSTFCQQANLGQAALEAVGECAGVCGGCGLPAQQNGHGVAVLQRLRAQTLKRENIGGGGGWEVGSTLMLRALLLLLLLWLLLLLLVAIVLGRENSVKCRIDQN